MDEQQRRMQQENDYDGRKIDHHELVVDLTFPRTSQEFRVQYIKTCNTIFDSSKYDAMCQKAGWPLLDDRNYRSKWSVVWKGWKDGLCRYVPMLKGEKIEFCIWIYSKLSHLTFPSFLYLNNGHTLTIFSNQLHYSL